VSDSTRSAALRAASILAALALAGAAGGVETRTWTADTAGEFEKGRVEGVSITGTGELVLSSAVQEVLALEEPLVLSLARTPDGSVVAGTGNQGRIYRVSPGGEAELLLDRLGLQVSAMAVGPDGTLYAAWNPSGQVLRLDEYGGREEVLAPEATYIWALAVDQAGRLYVATGDPALLLRVPAGGGEVEEVFASPERNFTALALSGGRPADVYLGTDGDGLVLRVDPKGRSHVLWDSALRQISALAVAPDGTLYAAAVAKPDDKDAENDKKQKKKKAEAGMPGEVVRIAGDGSVETLWKGKGEGEGGPIFSLAVMEPSEVGEPVLLAGSGRDGRVFALEGDGRRRLLADTDQEQVSAIIVEGERAIFSTANLGRVYGLGPAMTGEGIYTSAAQDAGVLSRWGAFRWEGETPAGTRVVFETRSGATSRPDETWPAWTAVRRGAGQRPAARRLQWRARLEGSGRGEGPSVRRVEMAYLQRNLPPEVKRVQVHDPGLVYDKKLATQSIEKGGPDRFSSKADPAKTPKSFHLPGWRTVSWAASDPNGDELRYRLELRPDKDGAAWFTLVRELEEPAFAWDTCTLADGRYEVRLVAADSPSNPEGLVMEGDRVEGPFLVDNAPPILEALRLRNRGEGIVLSFRARDQADVVASAAVSVAGGPWRPLLPEDGIADQPEERFSATLDAARPGDLVVVRAGDRAGNRRTASATAP